jgi:hypothetical protein
MSSGVDDSSGRSNLVLAEREVVVTPRLVRLQIVPSSPLDSVRVGDILRFTLLATDLAGAVHEGFPTRTEVRGPNEYVSNAMAISRHAMKILQPGRWTFTARFAGLSESVTVDVPPTRSRE